ncbi:MAG TPA: PAS domain S-box protein, partial [Propionibacteriaceae bacterium]|nr:PAS domain S-box protein [Propionibacteriaceae bacterium]
MSGPSPVRSSADSVPRQPNGLMWTAGIGVLTIVAVVGYLATQRSRSNDSQTLADLAILACSLFAAVACFRAARRRDAMTLGWALMSAATAVWSVGQVIFTYYGLIGKGDSPFLSSADAAYLSYTVIAIVALFTFPRPPARLISHLRVMLDALVIAAGIVILSESVVLHPLHEVLGVGEVARWTGLAYPILDITLAATVLSHGMGQPPGQRLYWLVLGTGLITLGVTDSIYVRAFAEGRASILDAPLTGGWMLTFFLIGLATLVPTRASTDRAGPGFTFGVQLIPYVPVVGALIALIFSVDTDDPFVVVMATVLLILVSIRQVLIVYENVTLTSGLEARVAARTAELNTLGSIVTSSSDAIVGVALDGAIIAWNPAAELLYGYRANAVLGRPSDFLEGEGLQGLQDLLAQARRGQQLPTYEVDWSRPDGSTVPVAMTISPIVDDHGVTGISVFGRDITEQQRAEAALEQARQEALES